MNSSRGQVGAEAGDRLELVEGAAGVAEAAAGELRHRDAAGRDQRARGAGEILSPTPPVECLSTVGRATDDRSRRSPERDHRVGPGRELAGGQAAEEDRHQQRGRLLVGDSCRPCSRRGTSGSRRRRARWPSRLARMSVDRVGHRPPGARPTSVRAEGGRQQVVEARPGLPGVDQQVAAAVLVAAAAGSARRAAAGARRRPRPLPPPARSAAARRGPAPEAWRRRPARTRRTGSRRSWRSPRCSRGRPARRRPGRRADQHPGVGRVGSPPRPRRPRGVLASR